MVSDLMVQTDDNSCWTPFREIRVHQIFSTFTSITFKPGVQIMQFQKVVFRSEKCQGRRFTTVTSTTMTSTSIATWSFPRNSPSMLHSIGDTFKSRLPSMIPKTHTMTEAEWRGLGVQQSLGWVELISSFQAQDILINVCPGSLHASWPWATHPVVQVNKLLQIVLYCCRRPLPKNWCGQ